MPAVLTPQVTVLHREGGSLAQAGGAEGTERLWRLGEAAWHAFAAGRAPGKAAKKAFCGSRDQGPAPRMQPHSFFSRERPYGHHCLSIRVAGLGREARVPPLSGFCIFLSCSCALSPRGPQLQCEANSGWFDLFGPSS